MKNLLTIVLLIIACFPLNSFAFSCHEYPTILGLQHNAIFKEGISLSIRLKFYNHARIESITMYLNNQPVRTITQHPTLVPFDWSGDTDPELANLSVGSYTAKFEIHDGCGNVYTATRHFKVASLGFVASPYSPLPWLQKLQQSNLRSRISEYKVNEKNYIKLENCANSSQPVFWYYPDGRIAGRFSRSNQGKFSYARLVKIIADPCG